MKPIEFERAFYIKLGPGGSWEESSLKKNIARMGWHSLTVKEINGKNWKALKNKLLRQKLYKSKGGATADVNALQLFVESTSDDIWITFHASQLWWGRLGEAKVYEDELSRYRFLAGKWRNQDINGHALYTSEIPGSIAKVQRFQGTICSVKEVDDLRRLINDESSEAYQAISKAKENLVKEIQASVKRLHWKDFETLVDLLFRNAGWRRISLKGEAMKFADIELEEPITGDLYQVQVKSKATLADFEKYAQNFSHGNFRKLYFVVDNPDKKLSEHQPLFNDVELILPEQLARMVVELGLTDWLLKKIR